MPIDIIQRLAPIHAYIARTRGIFLLLAGPFPENPAPAV